MSGTTRIRIDRLVLHGLPHGTRPEEVEAALRRELATRLAALRPVAARSEPHVEALASTATPEGAASAVAQAIGSTAGGRS